jgi:broad specificity phosphatase PhoE
MPTLYFITHPDVVIDPAVPVPDWPLSARGRSRMRAALTQPWLASVGSLWSSQERKALDAAGILANHLRLPVRQITELGENDRSATGYLPRAAFEAVADQFFAQPDQSVRGWESAIDAQRRIVAAVDRIIADAGPDGTDIAVVSHGGVGALLLCHLLGCPITRVHDQPANNGGNMFAFDTVTRRPLGLWQPIDPSPSPLSDTRQ